MPTQVAYLGPEGTYAEKAALMLTKLENVHKPQLIPCVGLRSTIEKVADSLCEAAVVPIENSVEGGVTSTLDSLWVNPELFISRAIVMPINHCLISSGSLENISEVLSHPQALAQCSGWLNKNLPNAVQLPTNSTAEAVKMISGSKFRAAIGQRSSQKDERLKEIAFPINDVEGNCTRFVLLKREELRDGGDISSIAFSLNANSPGALLKALECIAVLGLNMIRIESRPSKRELGEYVFFIDVEINKNHSLHSKLIEKLTPLCDHLVNFGCYSSTGI